MGNPSKQDVSLLIGYPAVNKEGHKSQGFTAMFPGPAQAAFSVRLPARPGQGSQDPFLASIVQGKTVYNRPQRPVIHGFLFRNRPLITARSLGVITRAFAQGLDNSTPLGA